MKFKRKYGLNAPRGGGPQQRNTFIKKVLNWEPAIPFDKGLVTCEWIKQQYLQRKAGRRVVE